MMDATAEGVPILWYKPNSLSCMPLMQIAGQIAGIEPQLPEVEEEVFEEAEEAAERKGEIEYEEVVEEAEEGVGEEEAADVDEAYEGGEDVDYAKIDVSRIFGGKRGKPMPIVGKKKKPKRKDDEASTATKLADRLKGIFSR
jgi:hypothetical protein